MSDKPLFVATHPRACSTAFERVFMTRRDTLKCVHEPFGDAYYFGPERLAERYAQDEASREASGFSKSTYQIIMERINIDNTEGKRLFIKDMAQYFFPPSHKAVSIAPSLLDQRRGVGTDGDARPDGPVAATTDAPTNGHSAVEVDGSAVAGNGNGNGNGTHEPRTNGGAVTPPPADGDAAPAVKAPSTPPNKPLRSIAAGAHFATKAAYSHTRNNSNPASPGAPFPTFEEVHNPTVVPTSLLKQFHFAFLIRHPRYSIPSYYRCCIPPLNDLTGWEEFRPDEAGYEELRRFFDYLRQSGQVGPSIAGRDGKVADRAKGQVDICIIDADDLLDDPEGIMSQFCTSVGVEWSSRMLNWSSDEDKEFARESFEKWKGFHEDAIHSTDLKAREKKHVKTDEELYEEWVKKYGTDGANLIKKTVANCVEDYEYLKQFCIKVDKKEE